MKDNYNESPKKEDHFSDSFLFTFNCEKYNGCLIIGLFNCVLPTAYIIQLLLLKQILREILFSEVMFISAYLLTLIFHIYSGRTERKHQSFTNGLRVNIPWIQSTRVNH
jgi:hypothetical protein